MQTAPTLIAHTGGGGADIFTYTIKDGDGDLSTAASVYDRDSLPTALFIPAMGSVAKRRCSRQAFRHGSGGIAEPAGSNPSGRSTTTLAALIFTSADGMGRSSSAALFSAASQTFNDATGC